MFRLKGSILSMSFLDCNGALIPYSYEPWKDDNRSSDASRRDRNNDTIYFRRSIFPFLDHAIIDLHGQFNFQIYCLN